MPKLVDHDERRAGFVAASWGVIAEEGLHAATLRRVAAAAGVTTGALTHYFDDREALLVEALRTAHFAAGVRMLSAASRATDNRSRLAAVIAEALPLDAKRLREWRVWLAFWGAAIGTPKLMAENEARYDEWRELLESLVAPLVPDVEEAGIAGELIIAMIDGLGSRIALAASRALAAERARARGLVAWQLDRLLMPQSAQPAQSEGLAQ